MHDQTAVLTEDIAEQFRLHSKVRAEIDEGYRGLANEFLAQVSAPLKKPKDDVPLGKHHAWWEQRRRQSSRRIRVEHTNAELQQWCSPQRFTGRRDTYAETHLAIASLVSDCSARRATRRKTSTRARRVRLPGRPRAGVRPLGSPLGLGINLYSSSSIRFSIALAHFDLSGSATPDSHARTRRRRSRTARSSPTVWSEPSSSGP
ncbi:hypothetical protein ACIBK8_28595 [Streptomyces sp. NPDC050161]|uniref:hypothetical protein n=1 Tax=Streptomyces sp. NPDC050161 TaxID=3365604 RepID=UPI003797B3B7